MIKGHHSCGLGLEEDSSDLSEPGEELSEILKIEAEVLIVGALELQVHLIRLTKVHLSQEICQSLGQDLVGQELLHELEVVWDEEGLLFG